MRPSRTFVLVAAVALAPLSGARADGQAVQVADPGPDRAALQDTTWELRVAAVLEEARGMRDDQEESSCPEHLEALGPAAAPALLDALSRGRVASSSLDPRQGLELRPDERDHVREALEHLGRTALEPVLEAGSAEEAASPARCRALLALEIVGRAEDLELAVRLATSGDAEVAGTQRALEAASSAIVARDGAALQGLRHLLDEVPDGACVGLVVGVARSGRPEALRALAAELDRPTRLEPLLLSAITCAAAKAPRPIDPGVLSEVRERLASTDPLLVRTAARASGALEDFDALPDLIARLDSETPGVRAEVHRALERITSMAYGDNQALWTAWLKRERTWYEQRVPDLSIELAASQKGRVLAALREVACHRYRRHHLAELIEPALKHPDAGVRSAASATRAALGATQHEAQP